MTYRVWYEPFTTSLSSYELHQRFKPSLKITPNIIHGTFVMYNVPTITSLTCHIYSESFQADGTYSIGNLLESSTPKNIASVTSIKNGIYDLYFQFSNASFLSDVSYYYITFTASGYTYSESSHIGWLRDWPEPNYGTGSTFNDLDTAPLRFHLNGQRFLGI